jgi:hypothetical protein
VLFCVVLRLCPVLFGFGLGGGWDDSCLLGGRLWCFLVEVFVFGLGRWVGCFLVCFFVWHIFVFFALICIGFVCYFYFRFMM